MSLAPVVREFAAKSNVPASIAFAMARLAALRQKVTVSASPTYIRSPNRFLKQLIVNFFSIEIADSPEESWALGSLAIVDDAKLRAPMDKRADSDFMNFPKSVTGSRLRKVTYDSS